MLEQAMESDAGRLIRAAGELEFLLESHVAVSEDDIPADVWVAVKALKIERQEHEEEKRRAEKR